MDDSLPASVFDKFRWAAARIGFNVTIGFSVLTGIGGLIMAPLISWYFFADWRFWRHWASGRKLLPHGWRLLRLMLRDQRAFMLSVPITSPPRSSPDPSQTALQLHWPHGESCGECSDCCRPGPYTCPLLDEQSGLCQGYDSFYWRYFNCGRFPTLSEEIRYYGCAKWDLAGSDLAGPAVPTVALTQLTSSAPMPAAAVADLPGILPLEPATEVPAKLH